MGHATLLAFTAAIMLHVDTAATPVWGNFRHDAQNTGRSRFIGPVQPSVRWRVPVLEGVFATPAIGADGTLYVGSFYGTFYAFDGRTGAQHWNASAALMNNFRSSAALGLNGSLVIVGNRDGLVRAYDAATGALRWSFATRGEVASSPVISSQGVVFVCSDDGYAYAINASNGALVWRSESLGFWTSSPALSADESVMYAGAGGNRNGDLLGLYTATGDVAFFADSQSDYVSSSPAQGSPST